MMFPKKAPALMRSLIIPILVMTAGGPPVAGAQRVVRSVTGFRASFSREVLSKIPPNTAVRAGQLIPHGSMPATLGIAKVAASPNLYVDRDGQVLAGPPIDTGKPPALVTNRAVLALAKDVSATTTTGPYRRVFSKPGYNYLAAEVSLPCGDAQLLGDQDKYDLEVGYIYSGGWGKGVGGAAIDAGFQFDSFHTAYSLFIGYRGKLVYGNKSTSLPRISCGQMAALTFSPESDSSIGVTATNVMTVDGVRRTEHISVPTSNREGWFTSQAGDSDTGAIVKRMTTIGQPASSGTSLASFNQALRGMGATWESDGSFFGLDSQRQAQVVWRNVKIGRWSSGRLQGPVAWQDRHTYGCHNIPSRTKIVVKYIDAATEQDGVTLAGPPSIPNDGIHACKLPT